jgi:hypothetical protein
MNFIALIIISGMVILLPSILHYFKLYYLISNYRMLPENIRHKIHWSSFTLFFRNVFLLVALFLWLGWLLFKALGISGWSPLLSILLIISGSTIVIIRLQKITTKAASLNYSDAFSVRNQNITLLIIALIMIVLLGTLFGLGLKEPNVIVNGENITFTGIYSSSIPVDQIKKMEVREKLPHISKRTNGFALGNRYKGNFKIDKDSPVILYVSNSFEPVIYLELSNQQLYFNLKNRTRTNEIFEELKKNLSE